MMFIYTKKDWNWISNEEIKGLFIRSGTREWGDSIIYALFAAHIIRSMFIEAYTIPTPSMEETLLVDDFLFVSKLNYGARIPITPISFPLAHNVMPVVGGKSYIEKPSFTYFRFPGWEKIENNDIVVFNYPAQEGHPIDKKDNYIKRCVGTPGDTLEVSAHDVIINGKVLKNPKNVQFWYNIISTDFALDDDKNTAYGISNLPDKDELQLVGNYPHNDKSYFYVGWLSQKGIDGLKKNGQVQQILPRLTNKGEGDTAVYPHNSQYNWNQDYYGPIVLPKKGQKMTLNNQNIYIYEKVIREYEHNEDFIWDTKTQTGMIGGQSIGNTYTFAMDYYFMMGDNRHNSLDSRFWGFVPEDHIVGKPVMVWLSLNKEAKGLGERLRWDRLFTIIKKD
jgi:signal peptidase I